MTQKALSGIERAAAGELDHLFDKFGPPKGSLSDTHVHWGSIHISAATAQPETMFLHLGREQKIPWFRNYHRISVDTLLRYWDVEVSVADIEYGTPDESAVLLYGEKVFSYSLNARHFETLKRSGIERIRLISADPFLTEGDHMAYLGEWM